MDAPKKILGFLLFLSILINGLAVYCFVTGRIARKDSLIETMRMTLREVLKEKDLIDAEDLRAACQQLNAQVAPIAATAQNSRQLRQSRQVASRKATIRDQLSSTAPATAIPITASPRKPKPTLASDCEAEVSCKSGPCVCLGKVVFVAGDSLARYSQERGKKYIAGADFDLTRECNNCEDEHGGCNKLAIGFEALICGRGQGATVDTREEKPILIACEKHQGSSATIQALVSRFNSRKGVDVLADEKATADYMTRTVRITFQSESSIGDGNKICYAHF